MTSIDKYISSFPKPIQSILQELREAIVKSAPLAKEKIVYGMPTFMQNKNLVHFAAYENHIGFYPTPSAILAFEVDLKRYKTSKGAIQFPINEPIPLDLVSKIVKFKVEEDSRQK